MLQLQLGKVLSLAGSGGGVRREPRYAQQIQAFEVAQERRCRHPRSAGKTDYQSVVSAIQAGSIPERLTEA